MQKPKVYLVGAGPGDPGLITLKGMEAIKKAECIVYDFLANSRLLQFAPTGAEAVYVGKKGNSKTISQAKINRLIIKKAREGKTVVRLKGGDPFIFGRGGEEAEELKKAGIAFEVIPGVTSAIAAPAYAGIPLTHRDMASSVTFITGQESPIKQRPNIAWDRLSTGRGTLVFLMGWKNLPFIAQKLLQNNWDPKTPVALIRWGTMPKQVCVTGNLENITAVAEAAELMPPVTVVVGDVVRLRDELNWFESRPLFGRRILVTRAEEQAGGFSALLEEHGAEAISFPVIKTVPPKSYRPLDSEIKKLSTYDWVIFTSANGVRFFFGRLKDLSLDLRELKGVSICAIGPKTRDEVLKLNIRVDVMPEKYIAEAVILALGEKNIAGKKFLLPRASVAREVLPDEIKRLGGTIKVCDAYRTIRPKKEFSAVKTLLKKRSIDAITFTSSSTVDNFLSLLTKDEIKGFLSGIPMACIGPVTAKTLKSHGLEAAIIPEDYTVEGLADALADYFSNSAVKQKKSKKGF